MQRSGSCPWYWPLFLEVLCPWPEELEEVGGGVGTELPDGSRDKKATFTLLY